jgi:Domain of unknown function (DUF4398)
MSSSRWAACALAVVLSAFVTASCAQPPDREMQQAEGAIEAARAAGADRYASVEFLAAVDALKRSQEAVAQRDYRLALNHALDSRERAQTAAKEATDAKAAAHTEADRALTMAAAALEQARAGVKAAEAVRAPARTVDQARTAIANQDRRVQEARAAFDKGDYAAASKAASAATEALATVTRDLDAAARPAARRRR